MQEFITFAINWRIAKLGCHRCRSLGRYDKSKGLKAAAVMGWLFAQCQSAVQKVDSNSKGRGWVTASQSEIGRRLGLDYHTVGGILRYLEKTGLIVVERCSAKGGRTPRSYTISDEGFRKMWLQPRDWRRRSLAIFGVSDKEEDGKLENASPSQVRQDLVFWGINEGVASKLGINAAVVFQYLWFHLEGHHYTKSRKRDGRAQASWTVRGLTRWIPLMSKDAVFRSLCLLESAEFIVRHKRGRATFWSIGDEGYKTMGRDVPAGWEERNVKEARNPVRLPRTRAYSATASYTAMAQSLAQGAQQIRIFSGVPPRATPRACCQPRLRGGGRKYTSRRLSFSYGRYRAFGFWMLWQTTGFY